MCLLNKNRKGKYVADSAIENKKIEFLEANLNPFDYLFGGMLLQIAGKYGIETAKSHIETDCKATDIIQMKFYHPIKRGDTLYCSTSVNNAWKKTLEVGIKIMAEDFRLLEQKEIVSAYFIYQVIDKEEIPYLIPKTIDEKRRFFQADKRKSQRLTS